MSDPITWPVAISIIGGVVAIVIGIGGFIIQHYNKKETWRAPFDDLKNKTSDLTNRTSNIEIEISNLKSTVSDHGHRDEREFEKLDAKIEKLTDLMIKAISEDKS